MTTPSPRMELTIVGLGSGQWKQLTIEAAEALHQATAIWLPPGVTELVPEIRAHLQDKNFVELSDDTAGELSIQRLLAKISAGEHPVLAVLGGGLEGEPETSDVQREAGSAGISVRVITGRSMSDLVLGRVYRSPPSWITTFRAH